LADFDKRLKVIELEENVGVAARNIGIQSASGEIVVTLDDDVFGLSESDVQLIRDYFSDRNTVAAINFRVIDDLTEVQINWCHRRRLGQWGNTEFNTYEISEGAVAFRRQCFLDSGMYPAYFFISHEGPDMALALMEEGWDVVYYPNITVRHAHSMNGRPSWRRYYYDTRNMVWLGVRRYNVALFIRKVPLHLIAMFFYSSRDGYLRVYIKALYDAIKRINEVKINRKCISEKTYCKYKEIEKYNPGFFYMLRKRVFKNEVSI
jgi:GT2 family glycosyltransferase